MSPHASWILVNEVMPRLHSAVPNAVRCVGSEDHQELIQDGAHMAAKMLVNAENNGKKVTAGNVAYYTIQHLKSGRRSVGSSVVDALATGISNTVAAANHDDAPMDCQRPAYGKLELLAQPACRKAENRQSEAWKQQRTKKV